MGLVNSFVASTTQKDARYDLMIMQTDEKWYPLPLNKFTELKKPPMAAHEAAAALKKKLSGKAMIGSSAEHSVERPDRS
ncbi:hypothetical protein ACQY0O_008142 [Thecaphora frezii]